MSDQTTIKHSIVKPVVKSVSTPKAPKTPSIPKLKFKDLSESPTPAPPGPLAAVASTSVATPAEPSVAKSSPKIVFKNLAVDKKKDPPKQADLFSDAVHLDRYVNNKYVQTGPPKVSYFASIATNYWLLWKKLKKSHLPIICLIVD